MQKQKIEHSQSKKSGSLSDFFESAKETAREIDRGEPITPKRVAWVENEIYETQSNPANQAKFEAVLAKIKDNEPDEQDKL